MSRASRALMMCAFGVISLGARRAIPLTKGAGYCVSVTDDGSFRGKVLVPLQKPEAKHLDALRQSIGKAVRLVGTQEQDTRHRSNILAASARVVLEGESRPPAGGCITYCVCAARLTDGSAEIGAPICGGACRDCWDCRVECTGAAPQNN